MADDEDIDRFLYGDEASAVKLAPTAKPVVHVSGEHGRAAVEDGEFSTDADRDEDGAAEAHVRGSHGDGDDDSSNLDGDDDDVEIVLDGKEAPKPAKSAPVAANPNARPTIDINAVGQLNGQSVFDVDLDTAFEERPWRKPGADITDYFNYGFNEHTWRLYCAKQRTLREDASLQKKIGVFDGLSEGVLHPPFPGMPPGRPPPPRMLPFPPPPHMMPPPAFMFRPPPPPPGSPPRTDAPRDDRRGERRRPSSRSRSRDRRDRDRDRDRRPNRNRDRSRTPSPLRNRESKRRRE